MKFKLKTLLWLLLIVFDCTAFALTFDFKEGQSVYGKLTYKVYKDRQDLYRLARDYDVAYDVLMSANPGLAEGKFKSGSVIVLPTRFALPNTEHNGIVVNLAERRIYLFRPEDHQFDVYPVSIGRAGWETPEGEYKIIEKTKEPTWFVPKTLYDDQVAKGVDMPKLIKPGPDNPLGHYAMRLSHPTYLIHGTNDPNRIGRKVTAGCINMYPEDIEALFKHTALNTPVHLVDQPLKLAYEAGKLYVEAHPSNADMDWLSFLSPNNRLERSMKRLYQAWKTSTKESDAKILQMANHPVGLPIVINASKAGKHYAQSNRSKNS